MPFQEYLMRVRCEHARALLLTTKDSLLDISLRCGFSDQKYFRRGFLKQYGCSPREYRRHFETMRLPAQQRSMLTTQEFLSDRSSLMTLEAYCSAKHIPR
ncbi:MAG: helix-turn-helix domain-containing protein [Chordicoccus sp.]